MKNNDLFLVIVLAIPILLQIGCNREQTAGFAKPEGIYCNWSAFDELSDTVKLDEALSMRQLEELIRLRKLGVQVDYYIMDAFWFAKDGGYRLWREESWPYGPDSWLKRCRDNGIKPGLWFSVNNLGTWLKPIPKWESSLNNTGSRMCLFEGDYLPDLMEAMQMWVDRGIRLIKFDFANFYVATPELESTLSKEEIFQRNVGAFRNALLKFRRRNPGVKILAYNGFGGQQNSTGVPFKKDIIDLQWLNVFDALYCGDPRLSDVPAFNFWRSMDIYSDHQVRQYEYNGVPLSRIDNMAFMIGTTGTCYGRGKNAWKGMLILFLARGGWANTFYGNLDLLTNDDARWLAKSQSMFLPFQENQKISTFGAIPGEVAPYG